MKKRQPECAVCNRSLAAPFCQYANAICPDCGIRALTREGLKPVRNTSQDETVPVYVDGHKCWRQWRYATYVLMRDVYDSESRVQFYTRVDLDLQGLL